MLGVGSGNAKQSLALVRESVGALKAELPARVVVGALGPKMSVVAGEVADGVLFNWMTPEHIAKLGPSVHGSLMAYVRCALLPQSQARLTEEADRYSAIASYRDHLARMGATALDTCVVGPDAAALAAGHRAVRSGARRDGRACDHARRQPRLARWRSPEPARPEVRESARLFPCADAPLGRTPGLCDHGRCDDLAALSQQLLDGDDNALPKAVGTTFAPGDEVARHRANGRRPLSAFGGPLCAPLDSGLAARHDTSVTRRRSLRGLEGSFRPAGIQQWTSPPSTLAPATWVRGDGLPIGALRLTRDHTCEKASALSATAVSGAHCGSARGSEAQHNSKVRPYSPLCGDGQTDSAMGAGDGNRTRIASLEGWNSDH